MTSDSWLTRKSPALSVVLGALVLCGCARRPELPLRAAVSGKVTLDGEPLQEGTIRFVPIEGTPGPKTSVPIVAGEFSAERQAGPVVGRHRIEIESTDTGGYAPDDEQALQKLRQAGVRRIDAVRVPPNYNTRSRLTETVQADQPNEFRFDLTTNKRR